MGENYNSWKLYEKKWELISKRYNVEINISGIPSISSFNFVHKDAKNSVLI